MTAKNGKPVYRRVILKLSGEALQAEGAPGGIDPGALMRITREIIAIHALGVQVGIVIGGGNLLRGSIFSEAGFDRVTADQMGMLATLINGLALREALMTESIPVRVYSALPVSGVVDAYERRRASRCFEKGRVTVFVGGTGNPLVTTDSAAALRGIELSADIVLKATKVDGVYAADPVKNPKAERFTALSFDEVIERRLAVMDLNAMILCRDNKLPIRIFNMNSPDALRSIVLGDAVGTLVSDGDRQ